MLVSAGIGRPGFAQTTVGTVDDLKSSIEEKAKELTKVSDEIAEVETNLNNSKSKEVGIKKDLSRLGANIQQLNLKVRAGEISVEKLRLELKNLSLNIRDIEDGIKLKRSAVASSLRLVQQRDSENIVMMILKNASLSASVAEAQNIMDLNDGLSVDIAGLKSLQDELRDTLTDTDIKKQQIEKETINAKYNKSLVEEQKSDRERLLNLTKAEQKIYAERLLQLEKEQEKITQVMEELEQKLRKTFDPSLLPLKRPGVLGYPITDPKVTQDYGATAFAQQAYKSKFHNGIDFAAPIGTPIYAAEDGTVFAVHNNDAGTLRWQKFQYGKYVVIKHDNNLATLYAHLSNQTVSVGQNVKRGDIIGYSGSTGYTTGPHIHFTVFWAPSIQLKSIPPARGLVPIGVTIEPGDYL